MMNRTGKRIFLGLLTVCTLSPLAAGASPHLKYAPPPLSAAEIALLGGDYQGASSAAGSVLSSNTDRSTDAWAQCIQSYSLIAQNRSSDALKAVGNVIASYPDASGPVADAYLQTGYIQLQQGSANDANAAFEKAKTNAQAFLSSAKDSESQRLGNLIMAEADFGEGNYLKTVGEARAAIKAYSYSTYPRDFAPTDLATSYTQESVADQAAYAKVLMGVAYAIKCGPNPSQSGSYLNNAISVYQDVIKNSPNSKACVEAQYRIGEAYYLMGMADSLDALSAVIKNYPKNDTWCAWSHYVKGLQLANMDPQPGMSAADEWNAVINSYSTQTQPFVRSQISMAEYVDFPAGNTGSAEKNLLSIISNNSSMTPECTYSKKVLAQIYSSVGRYDDAISQCNQVLSTPGIPPKLAMLVNYYKGLSQRNKGEVDTTIASLGAGLATGAADTDMEIFFRMNLAEKYAAKGDKADFTAQLDAVEQNTQIGSSSRAFALYQKGNYLAFVGDTAGATSAYQLVVSKYPTDSYAQRASANLAKLASKSN